MHHLKRARTNIAKFLSRPRVAQALTIMIGLVMVYSLARPQLTKFTAVRVTFRDCGVATTNRVLAARSGQIITFRVVTETDDTFVSETFHVEQKVKAYTPTFIRLRATAGTGWYGYKLAGCNYSHYLGVLDNKGQVPFTMPEGHHNPTSATQMPGTTPRQTSPGHEHMDGMEYHQR